MLRTLLAAILGPVPACTGYILRWSTGEANSLFYRAVAFLICGTTKSICSCPLMMALAYVCRLSSWTFSALWQVGHTLESVSRIQ